MAAIFQIRRGSGSVSLSDGELYVNKGPDSLQYAVGDKEITLAKLDELNTGSLYLKGGISASGDITASNLYVSGNVVLGGTITIGDSTSDNVIVNSPFSGSIIPSGSNVFDLGSDTYKYRNIHATSISGAIAATNGVISGSSQISALLDSLNSFSSSQLTQNTALGTISGSLISSASTAKITNDSQDVSITNLNSNSESVNISVAALNSKTGSYATTGSNIFIGNQTITGSLTISGSSTFRNIGPTILSGSVLVSGSINSDGFELDASLTTNIPALNSTFNSDFSSSASTFINKSLVLGDGKVLVAGRFESVDGHITNDIARFNSNGSIDTSFSSPIFSTTIGGDTSGLINTFVTQSDGKIIVGGTFSRVNNISRAGLARLDVNGSLDATFAVQSWGSFGEVRDIVIQNDDKIVCVGNFTSGSRRVNSDGNLDTSFDINQGNSQPTAFNNGEFHSVALLDSGSEQAILIGGEFQAWGSFSNYKFIVKLHPSGALDSGFAGTNLNIATGNSLDRIKKIKVGDAYSVGDNGYIYIAGRFRDTLAGPNVRNAGFARLTTADEGNGAGAFDSGFRTYISGSDQNLSGVSVYVNDFDFYDSDKILLGGNFITVGIPGYSTTSANRFAIVSQNTGNIISGWAASGSASTYNLNTGSVNSVTLIPSTTNVLVGGTFTSASSPLTAREGLASLKLAGLGNVTTTSEYTITANVNELLISSSNTYFSGNITASVISASFVGDGSGLTGVTAEDVEFQNILNKPTLISGSSQLSGTTITDLTIINLTTVNETASVIFSSGSNRFGDFGDDTHSFTGSVQISGSTIITGSVSATSFNGTINATNDVVSGSSQVDITLTTNYTTFSSSVATSISASVAAGTPTFENITGKPAGLVSGSSQVSTLLDSLNTFTSSFSESVSASIAGLASSSGFINYVTNSVQSLTGIEVADYSTDVAVTFINGTLKFIFGTPAIPTSIATSLSGFETNRFNNVNDAYIVNGTWSNQGYTLVSASLYEGSTLLTEVGSGTSLSYNATTSGSHTYRLEYTASSPLDGTLYKTSTTATGTISKSNPAAPTLTPTATVQLGASGNQIEQGATGSISFTSSSANPSNNWNLVNTTTNVATPYYVTGSATGSTSISITATANYESPLGENIPDLTTTSTATTTYTKIRSLRYGASTATSFTEGELENIGAWDTTLGGNIGTIAKGTTTASGQSVTITWTGDKFHYIVFDSARANLTNITSAGFGLFGSFTLTTVGSYKVYKINTLQAGGAGSSITYTLT
jgi:uncharacterized delta-60 repeat protein